MGVAYPCSVAQVDDSKFTQHDWLLNTGTLRNIQHYM